MAEGNAIVKCVISGDTVILQGRSAGGPPPERQLSLSSLLAPKVARGPNAPEEPYGWAAREYLRRLCVGFPVTFKVDYTVPTLNNREFGTITLNGESLNRLVVKEGWARVRTPRQGNEAEVSPEIEELQRLEAEAIAEKKGVHAGEGGNGSMREGVQWGPEVNSQAVLEKIKGKPTKMVIEYVRDGASFRAILPDTHTYINLSLAGVAAPRVNTPSKTNNGDAPKPEPCALESRYFTETRLLHRDVDVVVGGIDKVRKVLSPPLPPTHLSHPPTHPPIQYGTFYGTILHPKGNISVELLKSGLARVVDYSIDYTARENGASSHPPAHPCNHTRALQHSSHANRLFLHPPTHPPTHRQPSNTAWPSDRPSPPSSACGRTMSLPPSRAARSLVYVSPPIHPPTQSIHSSTFISTTHSPNSFIYLPTNQSSTHPPTHPPTHPTYRPPSSRW